MSSFDGIILNFHIDKPNPASQVVAPVLSNSPQSPNARDFWAPAPRCRGHRLDPPTRLKRFVGNVRRKPSSSHHRVTEKWWVQDGSRWFKMVQDGSRWFKMVQDGSSAILFLQVWDTVSIASEICGTWWKWWVVCFSHSNILCVCANKSWVGLAQ